MRTNYVLIDYENVQPASLNALEKEHFKVYVFVGASQTNIKFDVATSVQRLGSNANYVKISGNAKNALDFHIAFYIGQIVATDPSAYFHIISKDTGFDPLIAHLKAKKIFASRSKSISDIPIIKVTNCPTLSEKLEFVIADLKKRGSAKPRTVKTLSNIIGSCLKISVDEEIAQIVKELEEQRCITVTGSKVTYSFPEQTT